jgi:hypothetical protein
MMKMNITGKRDNEGMKWNEVSIVAKHLSSVRRATRSINWQGLAHCLYESSVQYNTTSCPQKMTCYPHCDGKMWIITVCFRDYSPLFGILLLIAIWSILKIMVSDSKRP